MPKIYYERYEGELYHHGIKGMRWGVRRFQNKDGTLTAKGKKRYDEENVFNRSLAGLKAAFNNPKREREYRRAETWKEERRRLISDARSVTAKAPRGTVMSVTGGYDRKSGGFVYPSMHIVDDRGKVRLSYIKGESDIHCVASSKKYVDENIDLKRFFRDIPKIEYDVYD